MRDCPLCAEPILGRDILAMSAVGLVHQECLLSAEREAAACAVSDEMEWRRTQ